MQKSGVFLLAVLVSSLLIVGVYAQSSNDIDDKVDEFLKNVAEKKGISVEEIKNITSIDFNDLPENLSIKNIDEEAIEIYQVNVNDGPSIFILTASKKNIQKILQTPISTTLLNFGFSGESNSSLFLNTATGAQGSAENGYVMLRKGSITGISTSLEVVSGEGTIELIIYKNSDPLGFGNSIPVSSIGVKQDFDIQSRDIINFEPGDTISVYLSNNGNILWKDVINVVEIST